MTSHSTTVAAFLRAQLALCGRSQRDVARELGYENPNIITMFKQGSTKVPLSIIGRLSAAVGADPAHFLRLALEEYEPSLLAVIEEIAVKGAIVTDDEAAVLQVIRKARDGRRIDMSQPWAQRMLQDTIDAIAETSEVRAHAAVDALDRLPRNSRLRPGA